MKEKNNKIIKKRLKKICACCGKEIKVLVYSKKDYRGGHYFGTIELNNGKRAEYWECPKCYWRG